MLRIVFFSVIVVALSFVSAHGAYFEERGAGYIYDGSGYGEVNSGALVINTSIGYVDIQEKAQAHIGPISNALGGAYADCGDEKFYCLTGAIEIVVPKAMPSKEWEYHDLSCQSVAQPDRDTFRITCKSHKFSGRPTYTYSLARGIVSIESSPIAGEQEFKLRGDAGLFSHGNNP